VSQAQELNVLVAGAFRRAYAHSQSPLTSTRHVTSHAAAVDTAGSADEPAPARSWRAQDGGELSVAERRCRQRRPLLAGTAEAPPDLDHQPPRYHQSRDQRQQHSDVGLTSAVVRIRTFTALCAASFFGCKRGTARI